MISRRLCGVCQCVVWCVFGSVQESNSGSLLDLSSAAPGHGSLGWWQAAGSEQTINSPPSNPPSPRSRPSSIAATTHPPLVVGRPIRAAAQSIDRSVD